MLVLDRSASSIPLRPVDSISRPIYKPRHTFMLDDLIPLKRCRHFINPNPVEPITQVKFKAMFVSFKIDLNQTWGTLQKGWYTTLLHYTTIVVSKVVYPTLPPYCSV